jgi:hypothetical protein
MSFRAEYNNAADCLLFILGVIPILIFWVLVQACRFPWWLLRRAAKAIARFDERFRERGGDERRCAYEHDDNSADRTVPGDVCRDGDL